MNFWVDIYLSWSLWIFPYCFSSFCQCRVQHETLPSVPPRAPCSAGATAVQRRLVPVMQHEMSVQSYEASASPASSSEPAAATSLSPYAQARLARDTASSSRRAKRRRFAGAPPHPCSSASVTLTFVIAATSASAAARAVFTSRTSLSFSSCSFKLSPSKRCKWPWVASLGRRYSHAAAVTSLKCTFSVRPPITTACPRT